jgi:hypothetical protein
MRNANYTRRLAFKYNSSARDKDKDLPVSPPKSSYGQASQMPVPVLHTNPIRSTITVPSSFMSSSIQLSNDADDNTKMGGTQGSFD